MKCIDIQVGDINSEKKTTLEQFAERAEAKSSLGKLSITLTQETAWSSAYTIGAYLTDEPFHKPRLVINHETFVRPLVIKEGAGIDLSLRGVEDAVRAHFRESREWLQPTIEHLHGQVNDMYRASEKISTDKARAAIIAAFPGAIDNIHRNPLNGERDLYAFSLRGMGNPVYVARELDHEFVGGVARIDCDALYWYGLPNGIEKSERHGLFWAELARAFASRELAIPEKDLYCEDVSATQKPWEFPQVDPYIVEKVVLRDGPVNRIVVLFGPDNLPAKAHVAEPARMAVLADGHIHP